MMPIDRRPFLIMIHALLAAKAAVKLRLKRQGYIVSQYPASQITELAWNYLEADRERLLAEAKARILASPRLRADWEAAGAKYEAAMAKRRPSRSATYPNSHSPQEFIAASTACTE